MSSPWQVMHSLTRDTSVTDHTLRSDTARRVVAYAKPLRRDIAIFLLIVSVGAATVVATPLLLRSLVDDGVIPGDRSVVVRLALVVAVLALADGALSLVQRWYSARIGEELIYRLRTDVFGHVLDQPVAFFTRAQTGALVSRLNTDVIGAQQAFTSVLSSIVSNAISLALILAAMVALSWQLTLGSLLLLPVFLVPARLIGRRLAALTHRQMSLNADIGSRMTERFNVAGAMLVKLYGDPATERAEYAVKAAGVRDIGVSIALNRTVLFTALTTVAALATAMVYGFGGVMTIAGGLTVGTLLALTALLARLYGPLTALSNVRVDVMTALVSFERVFELLDLPPLVTQAPDAVDIPAGPVGLEIEDVTFSYPDPDEASLASLQTVSVPQRRGGGPVLSDVSLRVAAGQTVALVGPSGAGKSTLSGLLARFHDPTEGAIRVNGVDLRRVTFASLRRTVGVVTQEAHLFHDTIRANLLYARPDAEDTEIEQALRDAQVWNLVTSLPEGLDTVVGDRGHRLSGGEKQRVALARLLLKNPGVVILDEATAHLDSESEAAVQRALDAALSERTAVVIAHRLSTIRAADRIVVLDEGRVVQAGTHSDLLAQGGLYADLYRTQFRQESLRQ